MRYSLLNVSTCKYAFVNKSKKYEECIINTRFGKVIKKADDSIYELHLSFSVHDLGEKKTPFDMDLEIVGVFQLREGTDEEISEFMNSNAVAILFPYLRTIISTTMTAMMIPPVVLPIIDAKEAFKNVK